MTEINCKIDYIQGLGSCDNLESLKQILWKICRDTNDKACFENKPFWSGISFSNSIKSPYGLRGGFESKDRKISYMLVLPGQWLQQLEGTEIAKRLPKDFKLTRLDIALDDYKRRVKFDYLSKVARKGNYAFVETCREIKSKCEYSSKEVGTLYFGSSKSNKMIRFYDAEVVHGIKADRWEVQLRRKRAESIWPDIVKTKTAIELGQIVTAAIDFIDRAKGDKNISMRCPRLPFWQSLIDDVGRAKFPPINEKPSFDKTLAWIDHQVGVSLAMTRAIFGKDFQKWMDENMSEWEQRYTTHHNNTIAQLKGRYKADSRLTQTEC